MMAVSHQLPNEPRAALLRWMGLSRHGVHRLAQRVVRLLLFLLCYGPKCDVLQTPLIELVPGSCYLDALGVPAICLCLIVQEQ